MKKLNKISRNQLKKIIGSAKKCPPGMKEYHCPGSPNPQCYWEENTLECQDL